MNDTNLHELMDILEAHPDFIQYDYKGDENQILIDKQLITLLLRYLLKIGKKEEELKKELKFLIKHAFELGERDLVLSKNNNIFIKIVNLDTRVVIEEKDQDTIKNRFSGINEDELKKFHNEFFAEKENQNFFNHIALEFVTLYFHEKKITNYVYEKNVFGYIQSIIYNNLVSMYDNDDGFFTGFAGYIFRIHFEDVFAHIADLILDEISMANNYLMEFLDYYASNIIVINGEKYQVPAIEAGKGLKWSVVSMLSISKIYTKTKKSIIALEKEIETLKIKIQKLFINKLSPTQYQTLFIAEKQKLEHNIDKVTKDLEKHLDALDLKPIKDKKELLQRQIRKIRESLELLRNKKKELATRAINQKVLQEYSNLQREMDKMKRHLIRDKKIIAQNDDSYKSMRNSLVKALTSKKKLLSPAK
ncbi:hypothetical protein JHD48_05420 [Sulfurimonas sp. SAG-AH-194-I05]|nr:hypothetical protein [Sulfurimonas sp. SAG-AH-194-I05]MDF1875167.1 hypothetical protein [Sulfurimonas sp. SAG-AH-194-I05]